MATARAWIDVDAAITWPPDVRRQAETIAGMVRGTARYVEDMRVAPEIADEFRDLFVGHRVRAYHATRLLAHEVEGSASKVFGLSVRDSSASGSSELTSVGSLLSRIEIACSQATCLQRGDPRAARGTSASSYPGRHSTAWSTASGRSLRRGVGKASTWRAAERRVFSAGASASGNRNANDSSVPPNGVIDFWQPGHPSYDAREQLPGT